MLSTILNNRLRWCGMHLTCALLAGLLLVGCGEGLGGEVAVTGKVTINGKPVNAGVIWFTADKSGAGFNADMQPDGRYTLTLLQVKPGDTFKVFFAPRDVRPGEPAKVDAAGVALPIEPNVPSKYYDAISGGLTATVPELQPQTFDFDLE